VKKYSKCENLEGVYGMKRLVIILVLLSSCMVLLSQPKIEFETMEYDLGRIREEAGPYEVDFKFSNTGDKPFRLIKAKAG
jgi:hypothetical protein